MTAQQFIDLVCKMRTAQKAYIRTRSNGDLDGSKKLEREVDKALRDFLEPKFYFSLFPKENSQ